jgi:hypothetical protein
MFIALLHMFRATMCPSSGENTVPMRHLVFVTLYGWLVCRYGIFSRWWAHSCPKHVEKSNEHIKENYAPSWFYVQGTVILKWLLRNNGVYRSVMWLRTGTGCELLWKRQCTRVWYTVNTVTVSVSRIMFISYYSNLLHVSTYYCHTGARLSGSAARNVYFVAIQILGNEMGYILKLRKVKIVSQELVNIEKTGKGLFPDTERP